MSEPFVAAVDWGTSNFRVWLLDSDGIVLAERQSAEGMQGLAKDEFAGVLDQHLAELKAGADLPVVIAGMAGARTGWIETAYLAVPANLDALAHGAVKAPHPARQVYILPGVCQRAPLAYDVMRGEETQLAGALAEGHQNGIFCLPGTHSKWACLEDGVLTGFTTMMTGELFDLISRQSILRLSVDTSSNTGLDMSAFSDAVEETFAQGFSLMSALFSIRAGGLLANVPPPAATARLSGLLIGSEISAALKMFPDKNTVYLVGSERLNGLYGEALRIATRPSVVLDGAKLVRRGLFAAAETLFSR
ncbi:2-dehydro-3-deoxygalactonokinase [Ciceribacter sp. L1K22]|uniref:2-dehydro-3-deoxygalactonokinase n=1 Tax=Ciceribacter sp. L1K22 TaxID=2820275 RepID=UPI001ABE7C15|nr:2-dehydro-3-deoxygalactonokinase [Ciceribacter sp. L1K22]MBO3761320.1 2-dehydro-3-deoxygalactonokinase [Ciceribacter sp. L1K22]